MDDQSIRRVRKRTRSPDFTSKVDIKMEDGMELDEDLFCLDHIKCHIQALHDDKSSATLKAEDREGEIKNEGEGDVCENEYKYEYEYEYEVEEYQYQDQEEEEEEEEDENDREQHEFNRIWLRYPRSMQADFISHQNDSRLLSRSDNPGVIYLVVKESQRIPTRDSETSRETHGVYRRLEYANGAVIKIFQRYLRVMRDQLLEFRWKFAERGMLTLVAIDFKDGWKHTVYTQREEVHERW